jgi:hypothetical protein
MNHVDRILKHAKRAKTKLLLFCIGSFVLAALIIGSPKTGTSESPLLPNNLPLQNPSGLHATFSTSGSIDLRNEFFQNLGTNGRNCGTCHRAEEGWTITPGGCKNDLTGRKEPIPSSAPMTARTRRMPRSRPSKRAAPPTACYLRRD